MTTSSTHNVNIENPNPVSPSNGRKRRSKASWSFRLKTFLRVPEFSFSSMDLLPTGSFKRRNQSSVQLASTPGENPINRSPSLYDRPGTLNLRSINRQQFNERLRDCSGSQPLLEQEKTFTSPWLTIPSTDFASLSQSPDTRTSSSLTTSAESSYTPINPTPPAGFKVHLKRLLGSGANGFCHEVELISPDCQDNRFQTAQMKENGYENLPRQAALKVLPYGVYQSKRMAIHREITIQRHLIHSNVLRFFLAYKDQRLRAVCLLLEYCSMGSLMDLFDNIRTSTGTSESVGNDDTNKKGTYTNGLIHDRTTGYFPYSLSRTIFRGMMLGLSYLHDEHGIVHRDIKPSNVLLADGFVAKLSDFGLACNEQQCLAEKGQICGTPNYLAPEVFLKEGHSKASDCWAAGATLYFMLCGRPPFQSSFEQTGHFMSEKFRQRRLSGAALRQPSNRSAAVQVRSICRNLLWGRYTFRSSLNQAARQTICALLRRTPTARPTATKVLSMDFCTKSENSRSVRIAEQTVVGCGTWSGSTKVDIHGLLDTRQQNKTINGQVDLQNSRERKHIPIDRIFEENRVSRVEKGTTGVNEENPSIHRTVRFVGDTVYTGNRAVYDVFKLLFVRVNDCVERQPQTELVLHWVSRWAMTNHPLLYYTLDEVLLRHTMGDVDNPEKHTEPCLPAREESWGVTNQTGQGLMQFKGQQ
ncbi:hypothetical protein P879_07748 [Paragonimus westermani]|uniref:Protein kinase domain-containing protein n=1 Tax=Paragonimus westermani TaxID=34504 RepID=A0A8T0D4H7_9TREM|nr:hypothetical protein P879_07748 [Paragonimus westermani]